MNEAGNPDSLKAIEELLTYLEKGDERLRDPLARARCNELLASIGDEHLHLLGGHLTQILGDSITDGPAGEAMVHLLEVLEPTFSCRDTECTDAEWTALNQLCRAGAAELLLKFELGDGEDNETSFFRCSGDWQNSSEDGGEFDYDLPRRVSVHEVRLTSQGVRWQQIAKQGKPELALMLATEALPIEGRFTPAIVEPVPRAAIDGIDSSELKLARKRSAYKRLCDAASVKRSQRRTADRTPWFEEARREFREENMADLRIYDKEKSEQNAWPPRKTFDEWADKGVGASHT